MGSEMCIRDRTNKKKRQQQINYLRNIVIDGQQKIISESQIMDIVGFATSQSSNEGSPTDGIRKDSIFIRSEDSEHDLQRIITKEGDRVVLSLDQMGHQTGRRYRYKCSHCWRIARQSNRFLAVASEVCGQVVEDGD